MMIRGQIFIFLLAFAVLFLTNQVQAQNQNTNMPIEVSADNTLEWDREKKQYIARGNAMAKQGAVEIRGKMLVADYREDVNGKMDIWRLTATGKVIIRSDKETAYGDKAVYDLNNGKAILTGRDLRLVTATETVTAKDRMEYWMADQKMVAFGDAVAIRDDDKIMSDQLSVAFMRNAEGKTVLKEMTAEDNVVITTPTEKVTGDKAVYTPPDNMAVVEGNVYIERGPNTLNGSRAEVNLLTNVSKLYGGTDDSGEKQRVRGVFYPNADENEQETGHVN